MKITQAVAELERGDVGEEVGFSIEFNENMARILSKGIYNNVIRAPIRELSCNAWDSHRAAGCLDRPFRVHLPNNLEPWFEVQDFGLGLSHQQILTLYTRYGASNKTGNNDDIGGFGLGSKAPFAYTDSFTVTSVSGGVRRFYAMYKNATGRPSVSVLGEEATSDSNGVTVRVPVKPADFESFRENSQEVFRWFSHKPEVVGNRNYSVPKHERVEGFEGANWYLIRDSRGYGYYGYSRGTQLTVVMANVAYPIKGDNLNQRFARLVQYPLVITFRNGELEPAVSREDLNYDQQTVEVLEARLQAVLDDFAANIEKRISSCTTLWEARVAIVEMMEDRWVGETISTLNSAGRPVKWRGHTLDTHVRQILWSNQEFEHKTNPAPHVLNVSSTSKAKATYSITVKENTVIVLKDCSDASSRVRAAYYANKNFHGQAYLVEGVTLDQDGKLVWNATRCPQAAKWLNYLGNPSTVLASSLQKVEKKAMKFKGLPWTGRASNYYRSVKSKNWGDEKTLNSADGGYYVTIEGLTPWKKDVGELNMDTIYDRAVNLGIIPKGTTVWGINKTNSKLIAGDSNWKEIHEFVGTALRALIAKHNLGELVATREQMSEANSRMYASSETWHKHFGSFDNSIGRYVKEWHRLNVNSHNKIDPGSVRYLAAAVGVTVDTSNAKSSVELEKLWEQVIRDYPLIGYAIRLNNGNPEFAAFVTYVKQVDASKI